MDNKDIILHILNSSGKFDPFAKTIQDEFNKSLQKILKYLPVTKVDVVVYSKSRKEASSLAVSGNAPNGWVVIVYVNTKHLHIEELITKQLKRTLAHELHHCMRWRDPGYGKTLFEVLITEGLAQHFDLEVNRGQLEPWSKALPDKELPRYMTMAKKEFNSKAHSHFDWFFGSKERGIPMWAGYSLGYKIVGDYLKLHPDKKPSTLYATNAEEFITVLKS